MDSLLSILIVMAGFILLTILAVGYLANHKYGARLSKRSLWATFGFAVLGFILIFFAESYTLPAATFDVPSPLGTVELLRASFMIAVFEEFFKFVPLMLFLRRKPYFRGYSAAVVYFATCGLYFGLIENLIYTWHFGVATGMLRLVADFFFHATLTGLIGFYYARYRIAKTGLPLLLAGAIAVVTTHAMFDFGLFYGNPLSQIVSFGIGVLLLVAFISCYKRANVLDAELAEPKSSRSRK